MNTGMLNTKYYDQIYEAFKLYRPFDAKHAVGYRPIGDHKIRVELEDGTKVDYTYINNYGNYVRERPKNRDDITREYVHNDFADKLRNMMDRRGFSQITLSEATGISQSVLSSYLRRNAAYGEDAQKRPVNPTIDKVYLIAWALGCDPYELL
jgi:hypothetical protein